MTPGKRHKRDAPRNARRARTLADKARRADRYAQVLQMISRAARDADCYDHSDLCLILREIHEHAEDALANRR